MVVLRHARESQRRSKNEEDDDDDDCEGLLVVYVCVRERVGESFSRQVDDDDDRVRMCVSVFFFHFWGTFGRLTAENDGRSGSHDTEERSIDGVFSAEWGRHCEGWVIGVELAGRKTIGEDLAGWLVGHRMCGYCRLLKLGRAKKAHD